MLWIIKDDGNFGTIIRISRKPFLGSELPDLLNDVTNT